MENNKKTKIILIIALIILSIISLSIGVSSYNILDALKGNPDAMQIYYFIRLPRLLTTILAAFGLTIAGLIMQQLSQNKFVSPTTATTIDGAKLGAMLAIICFPGNQFSKALTAFCFALLSTFLFISIIQRMKIKNAIFVPLIGLMLGGIIDAITTFISFQTNQVQNINSWMQGNLASVTKGNYEMLYLIVPLVLLAFFFANRFTIAGMGEEFSKNLGMNYQKIMMVGLVIVALVAAIVLITVGTVPFLGLVIPNIISMYRGDNIRNSLWETALLGAVFLLICDIISRVVIYPYEVSLSLIVGIIGSALFLYLIFSDEKRKNKGGAS
ncbi:ferric citrate ABC transporter permease [Erysipelotrichaceae bacterium]|nr:ferric citrate ABC transporter permease [Erysipelotrichaceae bacterium]